MVHIVTTGIGKTTVSCKNLERGILIWQNNKVSENKSVQKEMSLLTISDIIFRKYDVA